MLSGKIGWMGKRAVEKGPIISNLGGGKIDRLSSKIGRMGKMVVEKNPYHFQSGWG